MVRKAKNTGAAEASGAADANKKKGVAKTAAATTRSVAPVAGGSSELQTFPWVRTQLTDREFRKLKKSGYVADDALLFPGAEVFPNPPPGYRVVFLDYFLRGLSFPCILSFVASFSLMGCSFIS